MLRQVTALGLPILEQDIGKKPAAVPNSVLRYAYDRRSMKDTDYHVTDFVNGARYIRFKRTVDYSVDAFDLSAQMAGTAMHALFQNEVKLELFVKGANRVVLGTADDIEVYDDHIRIIDYKLYGSYAVRKITGLVNHKTPTDRMYRGRPVYEDNWIVDPAQADMTDISFQLSAYMYAAMQMREVLGLPDRPIQLWTYVVVKDAKNRSARMNGIYRSAYYLPVPPISLSKIMDTIKTKIELVEAPEVPPLCSDIETWNQYKCKNCPFNVLCGRSNATEPTEAE